MTAFNSTHLPLMRLPTLGCLVFRGSVSPPKHPRSHSATPTLVKFQIYINLLRAVSHCVLVSTFPPMRLLALPFPLATTASSSLQHSPQLVPAGELRSTLEDRPSRCSELRLIAVYRRCNDWYTLPAHTFSPSSHHRPLSARPPRAEEQIANFT